MSEYEDGVRGTVTYQVDNWVEVGENLEFVEQRVRNQPTVRLLDH